MEPNSRHALQSDLQQKSWKFTAGSSIWLIIFSVSKVLGVFGSSDLIHSSKSGGWCLFMGQYLCKLSSRNILTKNNP
ncbi:hypothetical protein CROQUDRAFT_95619 [Cronartium quercuum f. sp. fusiforme G11]|uniref:Uncharacterized protein n=1 Tax=Cronartium quercuum f. sp. fusiforme G11 TaxID=708437 RepID=A0A9P6T985_9BASI|nr:hypothetical protein CROQUDRAFT_95619 [Cronartium quercuum f. sp. fusiforme G11]